MQVLVEQFCGIYNEVHTGNIIQEFIIQTINVAQPIWDRRGFSEDGFMVVMRFY